MSVILQNSLRYWHTLRYLRPVQIIKRIQRHFSRVKVDLSSQGELRQTNGVWISSAMRDQRMVGDNEFCFLHECHVVAHRQDWNNEQWTKLWLYNLHYFDDLNAVAASQRSAWHRELIQRWVKENPVGLCNGWEPYPASLRIVNWIKWSLAGNALEDSWCHSLAVQVRYLMQNLETHLLGNHLFANAKALLFSGLFFAGKEAEVWYRTGHEIIQRELPEQVLNDGGNFELSTMYHCIFLEDLLDLVNLHRTFERETPSGIESVIPKMIHWLTVMCHPDGEIGFFNDAAIGITPSVSEIFKYANRLGFKILKPIDGLTDLPDSGYSRVVAGDAVALIDRAAVGPDYLPAHAHADTLSFELSLFGKRVIVNSGTSVYGTGPERQQQRSTAVHSTVLLDGEDSTEVWGGFRVARRANVFNKSIQENTKITITGHHDGYRRLPGKPTHSRKWVFSDSTLFVQDQITGGGNHSVDVVFHLHPNVLIDRINDERAVLIVDGNKVEITCSGDGTLKLESSTYHPEFGLTIASSKLVYHVACYLPTDIKTTIKW